MPIVPRVQRSAEVCATVWLSETNCEQQSEEEQPKPEPELEVPSTLQYGLLESTCAFWPTNYQRPPPFSSLA